MWIKLIKQFWDVSTFKESPASIPYSHRLFAIVSVIFIGLIMIQWAIVPVENPLHFPNNLFAALTLVLSYGLYTFVLLKLFQLTSRWLQTLTAILASHTIVHIFAFPLLLLIPLLMNDKLPNLVAAPFAMLYLVLTLALTIWQFLITAFIYKQALKIDFFPAILASLGLVALNILLISIW